MAKANAKVGDIIPFTLGKGKAAVERPLIVTSVNKDGSVNGRVITEPQDNPENDGDFQTFFEGVEA